jgi:hypothetical protein
MNKELKELIAAVKRLGAIVTVSKPDREYRLHVDVPPGIPPALAVSMSGPRWAIKEALRAVLLGAALAPRSTSQQ